MRTSSPILLLIAAALSASAICGQEKAARPAAGAGRSIEKPDVGGDASASKAAGKPTPRSYRVQGRPVDPNEPPAPPKLPGTQAGVVSFDASIRPRRVSPGAAGRMQVLMLFGGDAVMLYPPPVTFEYEREQGSLSILGEPEFRPPEEAGGNLSPALKDLANYDNYAVFDVPFMVAADAEPGQRTLKLVIMYEVLDGKKGAVIGRFRDTIEGQVQVVTAAADPEPSAAEVAGGRSVVPPLVPSAARPTAGSDQVDGAAQSPRLQTIDGDALAIAGEDRESRPARGGEAPPAPAGEAPVGLLAAGGIALVGILLLVLRRLR